MTEDNRSVKERLAALRASTGETASTARSSAEKALEAIEADQALERQQRESHEAMEAIERARSSETVFHKGWRAVKGNEERNPNNLYGIGPHIKAFGDAVSGPAQKASKAVGLTWAFNKAAEAWESNLFTPIRWGVAGVNRFVIDPALDLSKKWIGLNYEMYKRATFSYEEDGTRRIHKGRALTSLMMSLAMTTALGGAIYETPQLLYEGAVYATTAKTEAMIINGVHPVQNQHDSYLTGGCPASEKVCTEDNTTQYRIQQSNFMVAKKFLQTGHLWRPEMVAMAIPNQTSHCQVESAGLRWKFLGRAFDIYPYIVDVKCQESPAGFPVSYAQPDNVHVSTNFAPAPAH